MPRNIILKDNSHILEQRFSDNIPLNHWIEQFEYTGSVKTRILHKNGALNIAVNLI